MKTAGFTLKLVLIGATVFVSLSCISRGSLKPPPPAVPQQQKPVDSKAQQRYYDLGLQHYSKEKYAEARDAFQKVIDISPGTSLGLRARDNLKKIDQMLKTLREMKAK